MELCTLDFLLRLTVIEIEREKWYVWDLTSGSILFD